MSVLGVMGEKDPGSREGCSNAVIENQVWEESMTRDSTKQVTLLGMGKKTSLQTCLKVATPFTEWVSVKWRRSITGSRDVKVD
jgi:hypothetical protein